MAKSSVATAYVQVVPTTEGLKNALSNQMLPDAQKAGDSAGQSAGLNFAKKMVGALAVAGIGKKITDTIKGAVDIGGALQQSMGGIEALYGDKVAKTMIDNANNAFKTVGISANEYMEQVTGFSAALINSVGGDTERAASLANQVMMDMGDNVNRFGTDMESVQNAISGLSRGNFTMLDNLKLGFAGNQQGMIDLINSSGVLEEKITSLDGIGFDTMLEAIHEVQGQLNVTGTTASEASSTLQGSFAAMSAAWENLQGAVATGEGVGKAVQDMVDTIPTYLGNLVPMIGNVITGLGSAIGPMLTELGGILLTQIQSFDFAGAATSIIDGIHNAINGDGFGQFVTMATDIITSLATGLGDALPTLIPAVIELITYIGTTLLEHLPEISLAAWDIIIGIAEGLINALPVLIEKLPEIINTILNAMADWAIGIMERAPELISALAAGLGNGLQALSDALPQIINTITNFLTGKFETLKSKGREMLNKIKDGIIAAAPNIREGATNLINTLAGAITGAYERVKNWGRGILSNVRSGISEGIGNIASIGRSIVDGIWSGISGALGWLKSLIRGWVGNVKDFIKSLFGIKSPSRWARDVIGAMIPAGIAVGIEANTEEVMNAMDGLQADVTAGIPSFTPEQGLDLSAPDATPGNTSINVSIYAHDGMSVDDLYTVFERRLTNAVLRREAAYA